MVKTLLGTRKIVETFALSFSVEQEGWHLIYISAKVKSEKQRNNDKTNDEDLTVEIDNQTFPQLSNPQRLSDSPAAFSGGQLHGLEKTVYFILHLYSGNHTIKLNPDILAQITSVFLESLSIQNSQLRLSINKEAEDGDRRPWITFTLVNLTLTSFTITAIVHKRYRDSDDLKIIVDRKVKTHFREKTQKPPHLKPLEWFYRFWYFVGSILLGKRTLSHFNVNLPKGLHYIELWADRMPMVEEVEFDFGKLPRYPSLDDPKWTGDFNDDSKIILLARLILGEAENQPKEAKIGVGFTVINRLKKQRPHWGLTIKEIILKADQYDALWNQNTWEKVRDPLKGDSVQRQKEWSESYEVSAGVLANTISDPTLGATNFHSFQRREEFPPWATDQAFKIQVGSLYFYELDK